MVKFAAMIPRPQHVESILHRLQDYPVVAILGPRQIGKTTLAGMVADARGGVVHRLDLERAADLNRLSEDPELALGSLDGLVVIDEVQRQPNLFPTLRVLADRRPLPARFLVLGSASPDLLRQSSESLAGRIHYHRLGGLSLGEIGPDRIDRRWLRGGFPPSWQARTSSDAFLWLENFVRTFLERDLPQLGVQVPGPTLRRFWAMLAHWHGQTWNSSEFARSFGVADTTVRRYLDILSGALVVRQLQPWHANIAKRQVKAPKVYLRDTGVLHALLYIDSRESLESHPKCGASWEGLILEAIIDQLDLSADRVYFWKAHTGAEIDLLIPGTRIGIEIKRTTAPKVTPSVRSALQDLNLDEVVIVHAGSESYPLAKRVRTVAARRMVEELEV